MNIDLAIFSFINDFAGKWSWLDVVAIFCAEYLGYVLLFVLGVHLMVNFKRNWRMVAEALVAALFVRFILVEFFYWLHFRARPFVYLGTKLISYDATRASFPSGHASFYFALSTIVFAYHKKTGAIFYLLTCCIVISRVFVGVHWPSDILAGAFIGIAMGMILNIMFRKIAIKNPIKGS